ncbi:hypothetical protein GGR50DRAFT_413198 [Xylaria sp. CBS 124048]|nr:hypothetical protein GGR50DRAFT_413198 [Xylaria sp. CBS 124048]
MMDSLGGHTIAESPGDGPGDGPDDNEPKCMFTDPCTTGSTLRKAISHLFGRNKLCTRMIPKAVWVHYCRKHYQRSRYRTGANYSKLQCELVKTQIDRLQTWSDANKLAGRPGLVLSWTLALRKRESKRVRELSIQSGEEIRNHGGGDDGGDFENIDVAVLNGTAVPTWLREKCQEGYTTTEIQEIVVEIERAIHEGRLYQIPDIEFLPNISTDVTEEASPATTTMTTTSPESAMDTGDDGRNSESVEVASPPVAQASLMPKPSRFTVPIFTPPATLPLNDGQQMASRPSGFHAPPETNMPVAMHPNNVRGMGSSAGHVFDPAYHRPILAQAQGFAHEAYRGPEGGNAPHHGGHNGSNGPSTTPRIQYLINTPTMPQVLPNASHPPHATHYRSVSEYYRFTQHAAFPHHHLAEAPIQPPFVSSYPDPTYAHRGPLLRPGDHAMPGRHHILSRPAMPDNHMPNGYIPQPQVPESNHPRRQSAPNPYGNTHYPYIPPTG